MGREIRILYLHNISEISGGERSLLNLWENLQRPAFKPYLMIPGEGRLALEANKLGVQVNFCEVPSLRLQNLFKIFRTFLFLRNYAKKNGIDVIHSYTPRNNVLGVMAGKSLGIPVVWHERNLIYDDKYDITRQFLSMPDAVICNSRAVSDRFRKRGAVPSKVKVVLNGVNLDLFNPFVDGSKARMELGVAQEKIVGITANLIKRKRIEYFLEAASVIIKKRSDVVFAVVGGEFPEGSGKMAELKKISASLGLDNKVRFAGFKEDAAAFMAAFDVFVLAAEKEACARAIIEAMALGKPVVAMKEGGNLELVEDGVSGILVETHNFGAFVNAIDSLLDNDIKRREMGRKGRERAEALFDVKRNTRETEKIYLEILKQKR